MKNVRKYEYAYEKLHQVRGTLMAPHGAQGEEGAFTAAFEIISRLRPENVADLPEPASDYWAAISRLMDITGLKDPEGVGTFTVRVRQMTSGERDDFSLNVDELASWLGHYQAGFAPLET